MLLARRYLNPRRAMLSSFTMISVMGVMLGVLVLVVVMAVFAGIQREIQNRVLGFTPHILATHHTMNLGDASPVHWSEIQKSATSIPGVVSATPYIADNVIVDMNQWQRPALFRGIDTSDSAQIEGVRAMLDLENHPESSADIGIDDLAVISSTIADQYGIGVGATLRLYSTRNFEEVMRAYKATENPPVREAFADKWQAASAILAGKWTTTGDTHAIPITELTIAYDTISEIHASNIRQPERDLLESLLLAMEAGSRDDDSATYRFTNDQRQALADAVEPLQHTDPEKMDGEILKGLKSIVLPRDVTVAGVYMASQMAVTPDIFLPLPLAQDLAGLDDAVQGISLRLTNPYDAETVAAEARDSHDASWSFITWGDQYRPFFNLVSQQRGMMYFALSFIMLVSAFSMMAVMFTVTIQKRREIGVMKALGAAPGQIVRVFLYQGMLLGAVGSALGVGLGHLVIYFRGAVQVFLRSIGFDPFSASLTGFNTLPAHHNPAEQLAIAISAFILCSAAALVPAFFAARSDAAKSLRNL